MRLTVRDIELHYGGESVLRGCSFSFREPGTHILTGENGSGKSTLLRVCALLEPPDGGTVEYSDEDGPLPHDMSLRRRITLVLPRVGVFSASVHDNVAYGLRLRGVPRAEMEGKVAEALDFVGLSHKARQHARTLSSGETQRMGIARAIVLDPDVLFLDEPTASVDSRNVAIIEEIILGLRDRQRLVVMTTHDERQARRLGYTVVRMERGLLERI
jgi:tungstate transport system ATP-binding protein